MDIVMSICDICFSDSELKKISDGCIHMFCDTCNQECNEHNFKNCPICRKPIHKNKHFFSSNQGLFKIAKLIGI